MVVVPFFSSGEIRFIAIDWLLRKCTHARSVNIDYFTMMDINLIPYIM